MGLGIGLRLGLRIWHDYKHLNETACYLKPLMIALLMCMLAETVPYTPDHNINPNPNPNPNRSDSTVMVHANNRLRLCNRLQVHVQMPVDSLPTERVAGKTGQG